MRLSGAIEAKILARFSGDSSALELCREFDRLDLVRIARGEFKDTWAVRRLAALFLEHQFANRPDQRDKLLVALGLKIAGAGRVHDWLLEEGFTAVEIGEFIPQLLRKIQRRREPLRNFKNMSWRDWEDWFHRAEQECRLVFARYLFTPAEIVARIVSQVGVSEGIGDDTASGSPDEQAPKAPRYESEIVRRLALQSDIYWVNDATSSRINSLVEFPLGTVALVVKPPGSGLEIELKRAGMRRRPLDALFEEGIYPVPYSHRLQGGSPGWMLLAEARRGACFRRFYRAVHSEEPSMSRIVATAQVHAVPAPHGQLDLLAYFTDPRAFGPGFERMRRQLTYCIENPINSRRRPIPEGDLAKTVEFLRQLKPRQSIVMRTSSFRLDVLQKYLSPSGPESYFTEGLQTKHTADDDRRFADDLLEEVLGEYIVPGGPYRGYGEHIEEAYQIPQNRAKGDRAYQDCMRQIGVYWGTLMAAGGHTSGESFVARNIGLKSAWIDSQWRPRCVFVDHDSLFCPGPNDQEFYVEAFLKGAFLDQRYVFGSIREKDSVLGSVECLQQIFRVDRTNAQGGEKALCAAMADAYRKVRGQLQAGGPVRNLIGERLIVSLLHFDEAVRMVLKDPAGLEDAHRWLLTQGYDAPLCDKFLKLLARNESFLRANQYLWL